MSICEKCKHCKAKLGPLGFRPWCIKYKVFRTTDPKCIDFVPRSA